MAAPRKAEALHELHGTKPHDRAADVSYVVAGRPKYPRGISNAARKVYKQLCRLLEARRSLTDGDFAALRLYAVLHDRHERCLAKVAEQGEVVTYTRLNSNGQEVETEKKNLHLVIAQESERQMLAILRELGLTPAAKDKVKQAKPSAPKNEVLPGSMADLYPQLVKETTNAPR